MVELALPDDGGYALCGYCGMKPGNSGIVYVPYIPKQIVETDEEREARVKRERAGKKFAKVKLSYPDANKRGKRGEIVGSKVEDGKQMHCLNIELVNTCSPNGCMTWIGVLKSKDTYKDVWFNEDELENFEEYDENGEQQRKSNT